MFLKRKFKFSLLTPKFNSEIPSNLISSFTFAKRVIRVQNLLIMPFKYFRNSPFYLAPALVLSLINGNTPQIGIKKLFKNRFYAAKSNLKNLISPNFIAVA